MPRGDKSSYSSKQRRQAHDIEKGYEKRGVSNDEAERRAWATVNKQDGGAKKKSSHSSSSHKSSGGHSGRSSSHSGSRSGSSHRSRSRHSGGSHSGSKRRSRSSRSGSRRSRSRSFTLFGLKLPSYTPYILGGLGLCGLVYGLMQIDTISEAVDPVIDDIGEFFGITPKSDMVASQSFDTTMSTIH
jgi:hypothetical protein